MTPPAQHPKLPTWIFVVADLSLLGTAGLIAANSPHPFSDSRTFWIVTCVILGVLAGLVPIIARYERVKNETLDDRQRALEALARTLTSAAEQISIAAGGLHSVAELAQKNLRHAEQLPHKLQEKIAEFQAQLTAANDTEKEELEKELAALRTSESERLDSISDKIARSAADWAKLETTAQKNLVASKEAIERAATLAASATAALAQTAASAAQSIATATAAAEQSLHQAHARAATALDEKLAALSHTLATPAPAPAAAITDPASLPPPAALSASGTAAAEKNPAAPTEGTAHPPKRPRKPRRETPVPEDAPAAASTPEAELPPSAADEPPPIPLTEIPEIAPVTPPTNHPFPAPTAEISPSAPAAAKPEIEPATESSPATPADETPRSARKRLPKKPEVDPATEPALGLEIDDTPAPQSAELAERVLTSDGATRLIVTAYIGIGNRLFIRGEGPGLSWEKGVPLQFVSIGKWRWETSDANAPVSFKLYKNDTVECTALGTQNLDPGHQQEVTAAF